MNDENKEVYREYLITTLFVSGINERGEVRKTVLFWDEPALNKKPVTSAFEAMYNGQPWSPPGMDQHSDEFLRSVSEVKISMYNTGRPSELQIRLAAAYPDAYRLNMSHIETQV